VKHPGFMFLAIFLPTALSSPVPLHADGAGSGFAVVELFTSEGCSSCPPADEALSRLVRSAQEKKLPVYVLEWHVDYWDYLGWKDPWGSRFATDRQYSYASSLPSSVYTPQVIINGQAVASYAGDQQELEALTRSFAALPGKSAISLTQVRRDSPVSVSARMEVMNAPSGSDVLLVEVEQGLSATPNAGENAGRTLVHSSVVRAVKVVPAVGGDVALQFPPAAAGATRGLIALLEDARTMRILAAAQAGLPETGGSELSGRVVDTEGRAIAGVQIQACSATLCIPSRTDEQGFFTLRGMPAGSYELDFSLPRSASARAMLLDHPKGIVVSKVVWLP